ncbi:MAG TPA: hypothetical protein DF783_08200, partial [Acidimicrobiaceae bacterium]|nr:hypothetical protein [Acidimicrobiaceae bacterium]
VGAAVVVVIWAAAATSAAEPMSGAGGAVSRIKNHQVPTASTITTAINQGCFCLTWAPFQVLFCA